MLAMLIDMSYRMHIIDMLIDMPETFNISNSKEMPDTIITLPPGMLAVLIDIAAGSNDYGNYQQRDNCVQHLVIIMMIMMTTMMIMIIMISMMTTSIVMTMRCNFRDILYKE